MPVLKLSQIAASAANFADGDSIVTVQSSAVDVLLTRTQLFGFPTLQLGSSDAAAPVAQTLQVQSVIAGTLNTAGVDWTFVGSKGTGTGLGGYINFQIAPKGTTGTTQNAASTVLSIGQSSGNVNKGIIAASSQNGGLAIGFNAAFALYMELLGNVIFLEDASKGIMTSINRSQTGSFATISTGRVQWSSSANDSTTGDTFIKRAAAATLQLGDTDAAAPVAQTLQVQSVVAGTTDTAGADWTFVGSKGTGTGAGGSIIFKTAPAGTTGTTQNTAADTLKLGNSLALLSGAPSAQLGSGSTTSQGWIFGTYSSGVSAIWDTRAAPTANNFVFFSDSTRVIINAPTAVTLTVANSTTVFKASYSSPYVTLQASGSYFVAFAANGWQLGAVDNAAPGAQTLQVQSVVAGTSNTAGVDWTFVGSKGTGTGAGGNIIFNLAPAGTTGTAQNTAVQVFKITGGNNAAATPSIQVGSGSTTSAGLTLGYVGTSGYGGIWATKTASPSNTNYILASDGAATYVNGSTNVNFAVTGSAQVNVTTTGINLASGALAYTIASDLILKRAAAATLQFGAADAAAPVAQTLQVQSVVAGSSNVAGVDWTFIGSKGTGSGKGGNIIFQVAPCSSGTGATAQNPVQTGLSITASSVATFTQQPSVVIGSSQLNSSAVEGFLYIPTVNGPPTGAPTTYTGRVPIVFDSSNSKLYIYNSSGAVWVGGTVPGAWS